MASFDSAALQASLGSYYGVAPSDVTILGLAAGSVVVTTSARFDTPAAASAAASKVGAASPTQLSTDTGLTIEGVTGVVVTTVALPAPNPLSSPLSHQICPLAPT